MANPNVSGLPFRFRKGASIGEPDAESDASFLTDCFTDTGDYQTLADCNNPHRIIVGRTGSGKSALIKHLQSTEDHVIEIKPENLSLNYLANSDILLVLEKSGVKLEIFYNLLWKHVFAVELLRHRYNLKTEEQTKSWLSSFLPDLRKRDQAKERALAYLQDWGDKFWQETEYRIKEVTQKLESDIKAQLGGDIKILKGEFSAGEKATQEIKSEVVRRAQTVVNGIQIKALSDLLRLLQEEIFNDPQQAFYVVIDGLDENWIENDLRFRLIRSLIETVKSFRQVTNVKIVIALRLDLLLTVLERTRDAGFQEEKYQSMYLRLRWSKSSLIEFLNKRVAKLLTEQYTTRGVTMEAIFPKKMASVDFFDYLFSRTHYRPRDALAFVNECLRRAEGRSTITVTTIRDAEFEYSSQRLNSLAHEWFNHYPKLQTYVSLLEKRPIKFRLSAIDKNTIDEFALLEAIDPAECQDPVIEAAFHVLHGGSHHSFLIEWSKALFKVGAVGIKPDGPTPTLWNYMDNRVLSDGQIKPSSTIEVHPMLWQRLSSTPI